MIKFFVYNYPKIGGLGVTEENGAISGIFFVGDERIGGRKEEAELIKMTNRQLEEYFSGSRTEFDLPLEPGGTDFQKAVWREMARIPFGKTASYKDLAVAVGKPRATRAVGMACNRNPIAIVIPCHRVVGANGKLTGYAGGLDKKEFLLGLEKEETY